MSRTVVGLCAGLVGLVWVGRRSLGGGPPSICTTPGGAPNASRLGRQMCMSQTRSALRRKHISLEAHRSSSRRTLARPATQARTYRFAVLQHTFERNAQGKVSISGGGEMGIEAAATHKTGTVAQTISRLRATPMINAQAPVGTHVAGIGASSNSAKASFTVAARRRRYEG